MKFECECCGHCCKHVASNAESDKQMYERINSNGPLYYLVPFEEQGVQVREKEREKIKELLEKHKIQEELTPNLVMIELATKTPLVITWNLGGSECPFLGKDNKCPIHADAPLMCRSYPVLDTGLVAYEQKLEDKIRINTGNCRKAIEIEAQTRAEFKEKLLEIYGETGQTALEKLNEERIITQFKEGIDACADLELARGALASFDIFEMQPPMGLFEFARSWKKEGSKLIFMDC
ncbi:MAG: YkgJ family cysteine cluster protein [Candidatus Diapherotrites archaeon]|nr:YkgJ family cysteine cluster protein [Candidatus Diapherotrites archaeon]